ncbi:porin [Sideroxydans lithotrophicus]|uniref:Porin Gram-negative type n=1 Tax=Sideroxydans lithotrophicus (strain ES-1) TaxID=580332 RepID=D5CMN0_SIDLE|nr:porin [Sideroxydans lithotrophicus]ADE12702.1 porin Gram-negative type [Sideroxydans lithotrophicus ES-1]
MQKKIIALAIAAAFSAPAFADVQVYGLVDMAVANLSADGQKSDTQAISGGLSTSRVGLKSAEDVGNGMKVLVNLEYKIDAGTSVGLNQSARQQLLGLAGDFGTVAAGYLQTTAYDFQNSYDPTSGSTISPLANIHKGGGFLVSSLTGANRAQHALAYISPSFSGVTVAVNYSTNLSDTLGNLGAASTATTGLKTSALLASANYVGTSLPLAVGAVYVKTSTSNAIDTSAKEYALGGSYDFGVAKIFATYQSNTPTVAGVSGSANKAESVGATIPAGPGTVVVSYAKAKMAVASTGASGETVGYLYNLSKDVTLYGAYSKMSQDAGTRAFSVDNSALGGLATMNLGGGSSELAFGMRKKF